MAETPRTAEQRDDAPPGEARGTSAERRAPVHWQRIATLLLTIAAAVVAWRSYGPFGMDAKLTLQGVSATVPYVTGDVAHNHTPVMTWIWRLVLEVMSFDAAAYLLYAWITTGAIALALWTCDFAGVSRWWAPLIVAGCLPILDSVRLGNISAPVAALLLGGLLTRSDIKAGILIGFSIALKPLAMPLLPFLLVRRPRACGFAILSGGLALAPGAHMIPDWLQSMANWRGGGWATAPFNLAPFSLSTLPYFAAAVVVGFAATLVPKRAGEATVLALGILVSPVVWMHTLCFALPAAAWAAAAAHRWSKTVGRKERETTERETTEPETTEPGATEPGARESSPTSSRSGP